MADHNSEQASGMEKILNRIKKMLNLGHDSGATDAERETALAMAHKLMKKFNIDAAQVAALDDRAQDEARGRMVFIYGNQQWALRTAQAICRLFMCEFYFQRSAQLKGKVYFCVIGTAANASTARMLCEFILAGVNRQSCIASRNDGLTSKNRAAYRHSFTEAAGARICYRVIEMLEEIKAQNEPVPGTSLVVQSLYDREAERNKQWLTEHLPNLKQSKARRSNMYDDRGYERGDAYGKAVHLGKVVGSEKRDHLSIEDQPIMDRIVDMLKELSGVDGVDVDIKDGVVTLKGVVPSEELRKVVENNIAPMHGVVAVENELTVEV